MCFQSLAPSIYYILNKYWLNLNLAQFYHHCNCQFKTLVGFSCESSNKLTAKDSFICSLCYHHKIESLIKILTLTSQFLLKGKLEYFASL